MYAALCCLIDFNATRAYRRGAVSLQFAKRHSSQPTPLPTHRMSRMLPYALVESINWLFPLLCLPACLAARCKPMRSSRPFAISHFHFRFQLPSSDCWKCVSEGQKVREGSGRAGGTEKWHLLNCINFCTLTASVYLHRHMCRTLAICVCVCDLVFCFAKVYRICMAQARATEREGQVLVPSHRPSGHSFVPFDCWQTQNVFAFALCPFAFLLY